MEDYLAYNPRGNAKVVRMEDNRRRAVKKFAAKTMNQKSDECLGEMIGIYRRKSGVDGKLFRNLSLFELEQQY